MCPHTHFVLVSAYMEVRIILWFKVFELRLDEAVWDWGVEYSAGEWASFVSVEELSRSFDIFEVPIDSHELMSHKVADISGPYLFSWPICLLVSPLVVTVIR